MTKPVFFLTRTLAAVFFTALLLNLASCNSEEKSEDTEVQNNGGDTTMKELTKEELKNEIENLKKELFQDEAQDTKKLNKLLAYCISHVNRFPEDKESPELLDIAAQLAYSKGNAQQSVGYYERLINEYPDYKDMEYAYFTYATHLDLDLRKIDEATKAYENFIAKYPNSIFLPEAKMRMENIELGMEDIIAGKK